MKKTKGRINNKENFFSNSAITKEDKIKEIIKNSDNLGASYGDLKYFFKNYPKFLEAPFRVSKNEKQVTSKKVHLNINLQNYLFLLMHTKGSQPLVINSIYELGSTVLQEFAQHAINYSDENSILSENIPEVSSIICAAIRQQKITKNNGENHAS